jgi:predicted phage baseplate assembly protein
MHFVIDKDPEPKLYFGNGRKGKLPPAGKNKVRLISFINPLPEFTGNGLPGKVFELRKMPVIPQSVILQVLECGENTWFDWAMVGDFNASKPNDRHFVLDSQTGEITFGNGKKGIIPQAGSKIRIIACKIGGGEKGNVEAGAINRILSPIKNEKWLKVENIIPAKGGNEPEDIHEAIIKARRDFKKTYTAVTCEDYEKLALSTPGAAVARAKAIPLYSPSTVGYPGNTSPASVTVVVVPASKSGKPVPGSEYLMNVKRYLDTVRLITTEVFVVGPDYVEVSVDARVVFKAGYIPDEKKVTARLDVFLSPLGNGADFKDGLSAGRFTCLKYMRLLKI